jgi:hypothetical protein
MSDLQLNSSTWDLEIQNGDFVLIEDKEALQQFLKQRLQTFLGEWFLDSSKGVPYFEEILVKRPQFEAVDSIFKTQILQTPGIINLESFEFDYDGPTRALSLSFRAQSIEGVIDFNEEIIL